MEVLLLQGRLFPLQSRQEILIYNGSMEEARYGAFRHVPVKPWASAQGSRHIKVLRYSHEHQHSHMLFGLGPAHPCLYRVVKRAKKHAAFGSTQQLPERRANYVSSCDATQ